MATVSGDFQVADNFSKISATYEYRKLFENNQQFSFRFFAGAFIKNIAILRPSII